MTVTAPRWRSCSLVMISRLAGVSKGVSDSAEPVEVMSFKVAGKASLETEIAGSVAVGVSSDTVSARGERRGVLFVSADRVGVVVADSTAGACARAQGLANSSAKAAETAVRRGRTRVLADKVSMRILGGKGRAVAMATERQALTE